MSVLHPIISVTGSSGAGTTSVRNVFEQIFRREKITPAYLEGDSFHRYDRAEMKAKMAEASAAGNNHFSHFSPETNLLRELEAVFRDYSQTGTARARHYVHDDVEAELYGGKPGTFTAWEDLPTPTDILLYEGLHGAVKHGDIDTGRYADVRIGVVPVINLEWIQKIHRDKAARRYTTDDVMDTILRRMPDYVHYICPQFTETDINFQRVPLVDTSNPFIARSIPTADESIVIIRFRNPHGIDFPYLLAMLHGSFMSRANSIAVPGNKFDLAMQLILTPVIMQLTERRREALR
jgi:phosphoribulokinase